jgi:hypothetical protein
VTTKVEKIQNSSNYLQTKKNNQLVKSVGISEHKVLITGDRHAKKCATELRHNLDHRYEVCGFIKPGARNSEIMKTAEEEISAFKYKDVVILWGGANDISRNNTKETFKNLPNFMNAHKKANIFLINSLPRHDLLLSSCVNTEVAKFNNQIKKKSNYMQMLSF